MVSVGSAFDLFFLPMSFTPFHAHEKRLAALTHATSLKVTFYKHRLKFFIHDTFIDFQMIIRYIENERTKVLAA